jgi:hypothetical protein
MPDIILKKSSVIGKIPTVDDLKFGELALNFADGKLYFKSSDNSILSFFTTSTTSSLYINNQTTSVSTSTGALVVSGGAGIGGSLYVGGELYVNGVNITGPNLSSGETFETVNKNLKAYDAVLSYSSGVLQNITYTFSQTTIIKTFNYTDNRLTSIILSGDTPVGIDLTKTFNYTGDNLAGISYS